MEVYNVVRWHGFSHNLSKLIEALQEDESVFYPLTDCLQEEAGLDFMMALEVGKPYLIRTVTHYYTGKVKSVTFTNIVLEDAAWIPDTGRFSECLRSGNLQEVEPYPGECIINAAAVVDACLWSHKLPREAKR
jgi:hypothetical protein